MKVLLLLKVIYNGIEAAIKDGLFLCRINLAEMMRQIKKEATDKGLAPPDLDKYREKILKDENEVVSILEAHS